MLRLFSISAAIPDGKLHELMLYMEALGCGSINARPIPPEVSEMMARMGTFPSVGVPAMVPPAPAKAPALEHRERPKPTGGRGKTREARNTPRMKAMQEATVRFFEIGREFETSTFRAMLVQANPDYDAKQASSRLTYYASLGVLEKLTSTTWRVLKAWEPKNQ